IGVFGLCVCAMLAAREGAAATRTVNAGGDLQAAINASVPGDTILLQPGAVFTGYFTLPAKGGTSYITIRSAAADSSLPAAGVRMSPSYAAYLPKIKSQSGGPAFRTAAGATYWKLLFLEMEPGGSNSSADLIELGSAGTSQSTLSVVPQHLIIDRCYLHGDASYGQRRGVALNSGDTQITNSYFSDFKQVNQDTQAIAGWNGPGPYLIENNYLEAAGENVMFGGSDPCIPNLVPSNITIRRNLISKPTAWMTQSWTVKNLVELKNASAVTIEGNTIQNNWAAGQQGYSIVITPRNQNGTAPWSVVKDIRVQDNVIRHMAAAFNILGFDNLATSQQTENIVIRNNLMYDLSTAWSTPNNPSPGRMAEIGGGPKYITIDHNTVDNNGSSTIYLYGGYAPAGIQIVGFELTNNLLRDNTYGLFGDRYGKGSVALAVYAPTSVVTHNTFAGGAAKSYPTGNDFPTLAQWIAGFVAETSANYQLTSASLSNNAGTDGKDLGVDFTELNAVMAGSSTTTTPGPPPPAPAPLQIQFENYDAGGEGVAYHDTTAGNSGGAYRSDNVDIATTTDTGGGYVVGWVQATEWLRYTVSIAASGTYAFSVRVACNGGGGTFHIEVDGVNETGTMTVPNTGGWRTWTTITSKSGISLAAGTHVIKVVMDTNGTSGSVGNFNWFTIQ
ncbi:MAG TPA: carbohydrate-binding protein, partial [Vicinamibacterales bacterium]|nr:carbohydrate-binding protein [Vicinamibacterales bacterium]